MRGILTLGDLGGASWLGGVYGRHGHKMASASIARMS